MLLLLSVLIVGAAVEGKLPKEWKVCPVSSRNHNECLKTAINEAYTSLINGNKALGAVTLDPLRFQHIFIDQGSGPVSIKLDFYDTDVIGFKNLVLTKITNDWKTLYAELFIKDEPLIIDGRYKVNGKVLVLPIVGEGKCKLSLDGIKANATLNLTQKTLKGKTFVQIDKIKFDFFPTHLRLKFENLFKGDKALGDNMNVFLNENWREILNELKPSIALAFGEAFKQIGNRIFSKIETKEIVKT